VLVKQAPESTEQELSKGLSRAERAATSRCRRETEWGKRNYQTC